jgi:hypothetical protein
MYDTGLHFKESMIVEEAKIMFPFALKAVEKWRQIFHFERS